MDARELALKMLEWEDVYDQLMFLEEQIKDAVLKLGKSQTVGNVEARYSGGRRTFDHEGPVNAARARAIQECDEVTIHDITTAIEMHTETKVTTNWRNVCATLKLEPDVVSKSAPSVSLRLLEKP